MNIVDTMSAYLDYLKLERQLAGSRGKSRMLKSLKLRYQHLAA